MFALLAFLPSFLTAFIFVSWLWPTSPVPARSRLLRCCLAAGLALGASSASFFLWLAVAGSTPAFMPVETVCFGALAAGFWYLGRRRPRVGVTGPPPGRDWLTLLTVLIAACSIHVFLLRSWARPDGGWDAWAIWNLRARFLFRGGGHWRDAFSVLLPHPDYPLLLPAAVARAWTYLGRETVWAPITIALVFWLATAGLLQNSLASLRSSRQGMLAALVYLSTQTVLTVATWQYADVPLGFFFLATVVLFLWHDRFGEETKGLLVLAGIMAGMAAWTKNEGLLFVVVVALARLAAMTVRAGRRTGARQMVAFTLGLAPLLLLGGGLKLVQSASNDVLAGQGLGATSARLGDWSRYGQVLWAWLAEVIVFGNYVSGVLLAYFLLVGWAPREQRHGGLAFCVCVLGLMIGGYSLVFLVTPYDLQWHLETALRRLLVQLWPLALLCIFIAAGTPEGARAARTPEDSAGMA
jgi:hypothetical protein